MHTAKKRNVIKKSCYSDQFLREATLTPPKQHQKSNFSKRDAFKKETEHKHRRRPIIDLRFSPWRKSSHTKATPSMRLLPGTTN
jgi:hypothetical protein